MYDSDTMLITDNEILINAAKRNYGKFLVPTKLVKSTKRDRKYTAEEKADLDIKTCVNKIGEIINLSQELNSKLWDKVNKGSSLDDVLELYCDIAQLDVMSNLEIDSAKKENPADNVKELKALKTKYDDRDKYGRYIRPLFFKYLDKDKGYYDSERKAYHTYRTTMDYLQLIISEFKLPKPQSYSFVNFTDILKPFDEIDGRVRYETVSRIVNLVRETRNNISAVWADEDLESQTKYCITSEMRQDCIEYIDGITIDDKTMHYILSLLDKKRYSDISRLMFNILFGTPNKAFFRLLKESQEPVKKIIEDENGELKLYYYKFLPLYIVL